MNGAIGVSGEAPGFVEEAWAELYGLFSGVFARELTQDAWTRLCAPQAQDSLRSLAGVSGVGSEIDPLLAALAKGAACEPADEVEALAADFARLFIVRGPGLALPYESAYTGTGKERRPSGQALSDGVEFARADPLGTGPPFTGPADHIALGLSVMQHFAQEAARQLSSGGPADALSKRLAFFERRLARWVPAWVVDVRAGASTAFYREAAGTLDEVLRRDAEWLRRAVGRAW